MTSLFIFRRDLRLDDNTSLIKACQESKKVYPIFIITPVQVGTKNTFRSENSIQFLHESLQDLLDSTNGKLMMIHGDNNKVIEDILKKNKKESSSDKITKVYCNQDYTPFSKKRDTELKELLNKYDIELCTFEDYTLTPVDSILTDSGTPYSKYTPYKNKAKKVKVHEPVDFTKAMKDKLYKLDYTGNGNDKDKDKDVGIDILKKYYTDNPNINVHGGRVLGLQIIKNSKNFVDYVKNRNTLTYKTTFLSAYIKFGCISLREVYHGFHKNLPADSAFFDELYWHDFYAQAIYHYPKVLEGKSMDERFDKIKWTGTWKQFEKWCQGETGFPIVDAAMKQLNTTGFMHNRARMIVASFLVKTLLCDWRWGEKYFAQKLVDYDPASNVGGWLWTAGGGFDSQPYFRIFNPWTQSEKFDKDAEYIKYWLPELKDIPAKDLHTWNMSYEKYQNTTKKINYPEPMVDYSKNRVKALDLYKKYL